MAAQSSSGLQQLPLRQSVPPEKNDRVWLPEKVDPDSDLSPISDQLMTSEAILARELGLLAATSLRARGARAERRVTSCNECRRRKQKCSQGQPCSNCAARSSKPTCVYRPNKRSQPASPSEEPRLALILRPLLFADVELPGISDGLLAATPPPWARQYGAGVINARWSGLEMTTHFPTSPGFFTESASELQDPWSLSWVDAVSLPECGRDCSLHSDAMHDAIRVISLHRASIPDRFLHPDWHLEGLVSLLGDPMAVVEAGSGDMHHLPMEPNILNAELLRIYVKLLARFKACVDGNPDVNNPMMRIWVPFCISNPLLLHIILYTSACFLGETGHVPRTVVMSIKGTAICRLNTRLRDPSPAVRTDDVAIGGVVQLIVDEWYWGDTADLRAHMRGLREMVRLRGGLRNLGMNGFLGKFVVVNDIVIALVHESKPFISGGPELDFDDPIAVPFRLAHNTPLVSGLAPFSECASLLGLHPATASILDDVRFLTKSVLALPATPTPQQLQKIVTTSAWVQDRICSLPPNTPSAARGSQFQVKPDPGGVPVASGQPSSSSSASPSGFPMTTADCMYSCVRQVALIYCRALMQGQPMSKACSSDDFIQVWTMTWRVPLSVWRGAVGIFMWVTLAIVPRCHGTPHERFVKTMSMIAVMSLALDNWHVAMDAARAALGLQTWLARFGEAAETGEGERADEPRATSSADMVAYYGFQKPGWEDERSEH